MNGMDGLKLAGMAASLAVGAPAAHAAEAQPAAPIRIGMIDTTISRLPDKDDRVRIVSKDMTGGHAARWVGESGYSHGELVAASAVKAARVQSPDAPITIYAANVFRPSDSDANHRRFTKGGLSDTDASKVHMTLDYGAADKAVSWMKEEGVSVVVITATGADTPAMKALATKVQGLGMVLVASTNNASVRGKVYPAAYPEVISVAGNDKSLPVWQSPELASYVSYASDGRAPIRGNVREIGSSFAAGAVAGMLATRSSSVSDMTSADAKAWLSAIATTIDCSGYPVRQVRPDVRYDIPVPERVAARDAQAVASQAVQPAPVTASRKAAMAAMVGSMMR